jgi:hypothetical protein
MEGVLMDEEEDPVNTARYQGEQTTEGTVEEMLGNL